MSNITPVLSRDAVRVRIGSTRLERLNSAYAEHFGASARPAFYSVAPGRVNLIGEHIDYMGYSVLPMALDQSVAIAGSAELFATETRADLCVVVEVCNTNEQYTMKTVASNALQLEIDANDTHWSKYALAGIQGCLDIPGFAEKALKGKGIRISLCVDGTVPPGSGLSSSSALVCASLLATLTALTYDSEESTVPQPFLDNAINKEQLAQIAAQSEKYVGVEGGGMDQAISFLGAESSALRIDFNPVVGHPVSLPSSYCFVIANSLHQAHKASTDGYNTRVAECRLAIALLHSHFMRDAAFASKLSNLALPVTSLKPLIDALGISLTQASEVIGKVLHTGVYTLDEVSSKLGISPEEVRNVWLQRKAGGLLTNASAFVLRERIQHVVQESMRVYEFQHLSEAADLSDDEKAKGLGELMSASHRSCDELYDCSCSQLNTLVRVCMDAGALGSRLTGAGWGGATVSLVPKASVQEFISQVESNYYSKQQLPVKDGNGSSFVFASPAAAGATVFA